MSESEIEAEIQWYASVAANNAAVTGKRSTWCFEANGGEYRVTADVTIYVQSLPQ